MKKYMKPLMEGQMFVANEFVSACYSISCNVPYGFGYIEQNNEPGYQDNEDKYIDGGADGCGTTHTAHGIDAAGPSANAMWQPQKFDYYKWQYVNDGDPYAVFWWEQKSHGNSSNHFSKVSDAQWEKNPNASN